MCFEQIVLPCHQIHALQVIVHRHGKMIAGRGILAGQDDIAGSVPGLPFRYDAATAMSEPRKRPDPRHGLLHIESQGIGRPTDPPASRSFRSDDSRRWQVPG
ncbi:MAG: hypothetical protein FD153_1424 [Rhodospirillaceae bacterium]|nr:MAG: hypothetical protein FD153_1424 [Rhodospirillaceae bacterium]